MQEGLLCQAGPDHPRYVNQTEEVNVVNGDYGNQSPLSVAARDVAAETGWPVTVINYPGLVEVAAQVSGTAPAGPGFYHADEMETSVVMALRPDLVRQHLAVAAYPQFPPTWGSVPANLAPISPTGVFGDPRPATPAKGRRALEMLAERAIAQTRYFLVNAL